MNTTDVKTGNEATEVLEQVGALKKATKDLKNVAGSCDVSPEEVGSWITVIGKALLSIFK